jgi:hypothetical protein
VLTDPWGALLDVTCSLRTMLSPLFTSLAHESNRR